MPDERRHSPIPWQNAPRGDAAEVPDRRDGSVYLYDADAHLALEVARATGRPLLLRGDPGIGKSSLAAFVARNLGWRYFERVVTAATRAEDFLWSYDAVARLSDAQARQQDDPVTPRTHYIDPGVLWWALNPASATRRGVMDDPAPPPAEPPKHMLNAAPEHPENAVVLIDELDKADPSVPNGLLVALGSGRFQVPETGIEVTREGDGELLVIITTNEERELPPAFLRRCVVHTLTPPEETRLVEIARLHFPSTWFTADFASLCLEVAIRVVQLREEAHSLKLRRASTAEYLDAVRACHELGVAVPSDGWDKIRRLTVAKDERLA